MKLVRYGPAGKEKPGLIDADGKLRDLSRKVEGHRRGDARAREAQGAREARPEASCRSSRASRASAPASRRRRSSSRSASTSPTTRRRPARRFPSIRSCSSSRRRASSAPNDNVMVPKDSTQLDWEVELGVVIGRTARYVDGEGRAQVRRRLLRRQRRVRARIPAEEEREPVEQGQGLRHLRAARPVARHDRRDQGPAESRHVARRQRRAPPDRQHEDDDLRRRGARRRRVAVHDAAARRRDHHRHAARRRHGDEAARRGSRPAT